MMSDSDMSRLDAARGAVFDHMFLTMMIDHHAGAIEMAKTEQSKGKNADAITLAQKIEAAQTTEIAEMRKLLTPVHQEGRADQAAVEDFRPLTLYPPWVL